MNKKVFTSVNFGKLKLTCNQIASLADENINGDLMAVQLQILGDKITEFANNPIVRTSGCLDE